jgi:hypothetical protein
MFKIFEGSEDSIVFILFDRADFTSERQILMVPRHCVNLPFRQSSQNCFCTLSKELLSQLDLKACFVLLLVGVKLIGY